MRPLDDAVAGSQHAQAVFRVVGDEAGQRLEGADRLRERAEVADEALGAIIRGAGATSLDAIDRLGDDPPHHLADDDFPASPPAIQRGAADPRGAGQLLHIDSPALEKPPVREVDDVLTHRFRRRARYRDIGFRRRTLAAGHDYGLVSSA
ncbi:hypothetical protein [Nocardia sp. NPDC060249]|uniref:hypothetical protein n=1 Tax=Nocardia sp. NPDC060249 TaxID=3347082 RepID=UPI003656394B